MTFNARDPQFNEVEKIRYDVVPYAGIGGFDLGCGANKVFPHFVGIDNGVDTTLFNVTMQPDFIADCTKLPQFADGATECVFSSHLLEHIEDYRAALREWWRLVKVDGYLVLYLPHRDLYPRIGEPDANPDHKHDFAPDDILDAMREIASDADALVNDTRDGLREYSFFQVYQKLPAGRGWNESWLAPKPEKTAGIVRPGAYGDAIWSSSLTAELKRQGYHVTLYTGRAGAEVCAADPNVDRIIRLHDNAFPTDADWMLYYLWESRKYDRFHNMVGVVEVDLLPHPHDVRYQWPAAVRHARMNVNYLEAMHAVAQLPVAKYEQRFYPTAEERAWAVEQRAKLFNGPLVVVAPCGSGQPKTWPHVQDFIDLMAARQVYTLVVGDLRQEIKARSKYQVVIGRDLQIRQVMALAQTADVVVGTESAILNAVANEDQVLKVALLSHSSGENLTKHWSNTLTVEPAAIKCHPCHRLHVGFQFCTKDATTGFAACQAAVGAELVADAIGPTLDRLQVVDKAA
jgi:ADP-heptose:LPS heptosyltransferase/predicted SAM-dependent methyltransferase